MNDPDLSKIDVKVLISELLSRFENAIFCGDIPTESGDRRMLRDYVGHPHITLGLCEYLKLLMRHDLNTIVSEGPDRSGGDAEST